MNRLFLKSCARGVVITTLFACAITPALAHDPVSPAAPTAAPVSATTAVQGGDLNRYLFDAARSGDTDVLKSLLARGVPVDARDERGSTALILAAYYGHADAVRALLAAGAAPDLGDSARGNTALMGALFKGEIECARLLLADPRSDVDARNAAGQTAAMFAALFGRAELVEALAARDADFAVTDASGATAETLARGQGNAALADRLLVLSRKRGG
jgi:ankyrin repeat protein